MSVLIWKKKKHPLFFSSFFVVVCVGIIYKYIYIFFQNSMSNQPLFSWYVYSICMYSFDGGEGVVHSQVLQFVSPRPNLFFSRRSG